MATLLGSSWGDFQTYMKYSTSSTSTKYSVTFTEGGIKQNCSYSAYPFEGTLSATGYDSVSTSISNKTRYDGYHALFTTDRTFTWSRKTSAYTVAIRVTCGKDISGGSSGYVRKEFTVPALASYKVTFKPNGGTGGPSSQTKYYGNTLTLSSSKPTRSGYTFVGWGTSSTDTSKNYDPGDSYTANASETLYAIWKKTITLTFNDNGGSGQPAAKSVTVYNATTSYKFSIPSSSSNPTKSGYTFLGWSKSSTATSASYAAGGTITLSSSDTLYAIWKKTITLSYNVNGGSGSIGSQSATVYNATTSYKFTLSSTKPTRTNYIFLGWATSSSATSASYAAGGTITLSSSDTLYAVWEKAYVKPKITSVLATRVTVQEDLTYKTDDEGVSGAVSFKWSAGTLGGTALVPTNIKVECSIQGKNAFKEVYTGTPTDTSGSVVTDAFQLLDENGSTELSQDTQYDIKITVTDSDGGNYASTFISKAVFIIDVNAAGDSVSIGEVASDDDKELFNVAWKARFKNDIYLDNNDYIYGYDTSGTATNLIGINGSDQILVGYGSYNLSKGRTNIYGNAMSLNSKAEINLIASNNVNVNTSIHLTTNRTYLMGRSTDGTSLTLIGVNNSDNLLVGYGGYSSNIGSTQLYGNKLELYSKGAIWLYSDSGVRSDAYISSATNLYVGNNYRLRGMKNGYTTPSVDNSNIIAGILSDNNRVHFGSAGNSAATEVRSPSVIYFKGNGTSLDESRYTVKLSYTTVNEVGYGLFMPSYNTDAGTSYTNLGYSSCRWRNVYATNGTISTSDRNLKKDIQNLSEKYLELFDLLQPVSYKMLEGDRTHVGFIAQDVEEAMNTIGLSSEDFAGFCKDIKYSKDVHGYEFPVVNDNGEYEYSYSLRYSEFIPIAIAKIKKLEEEIKELKGRTN